MANVLILEDMHALRRMLTHVLNEDGHIVTEGDCGLITHDPDSIVKIDVMITDLYMPLSDGIDAILMAKKAKPNIKIIAMSGGGKVLKRDYLRASLHLGATEILRKPFEPDDMLACVNRVLAA